VSDLWLSRHPQNAERSSEDRAKRLGRVVRLLRQEGWMVTVWSDGFLRIWDARYPPPRDGNDS
jgi:hypothetical protein